MPMSRDDIETHIRAAFPDADIAFQDLAGDNDHWAITVTSSAFAGKSRVTQHRLVNAALGDKLGTTLHALSITTRAP